MRRDVTCEEGTSEGKGQGTRPFSFLCILFRLLLVFFQPSAFSFFSERGFFVAPAGITGEFEGVLHVVGGGGGVREHCRA